MLKILYWYFIFKGWRVKVGASGEWKGHWTTSRKIRKTGDKEERGGRKDGCGDGRSQNWNKGKVRS